MPEQRDLLREREKTAAHENKKIRIFVKDTVEYSRVAESQRHF